MFESMGIDAGRKKAGRMKDEAVVFTQEEVDRIRYHRAICTVYNLQLGTLWWVKEAVWSRILGSHYHRPRSPRKGHPGLSISKAPPETPYDMIPMLHGTSGSRGPVVVRGVSPDHAPDYATSFGHFVPVDLGVDDFRGQQINENLHKAKLAPEEMIVLNNWLLARGLA